MQKASLYLFAQTASLAAVGALALGSAQAEPVAPSSVTPAQLRPAPSAGGSIALPASSELAAPPQAANLALTLSGVVVQGGFDDMAAQTRTLTDGLVGRRITVADIYAAASALEAAYGAAGYALARVVVPPQRLEPRGKLKLIVVDGYIESINVKGVPERQRGVVSARLAALIGQRHVRLTDIERRVLLASAVPGLALKSTLTTGATSGGAMLVVEATDRLVAGQIGVDNNLPRSLRDWELNSGVQINSPFGYGEQFYLSATSGYNLERLFDGTSPIQIFGAGLAAPIGVDGLTINPEYTNAITRPTPFGGLPQTTGYFQRADLRLSYPVILTRKETLTLSSVVEWDRETLRPDGLDDLYDDDYYVWRGKAESLTALPGGASVEASGALSQGLGGRNAFGSVIPLSQQGASPHFTKFNVDAHWGQPLPQMFSLALSGAAQTSFGRPLMIAEQFSLDGPGAVSGFPSGTFIVDEGAYGRAELGRTFALPAFGKTVPVAPYLFGAAGFGTIDDPTAAQQADVDVGSVGLGVRASIAESETWPGADLAVELARYFSDVPGEREGWRGNFAFTVRY